MRLTDPLVGVLADTYAAALRPAAALDRASRTVGGARGLADFRAADPTPGLAHLRVVGGRRCPSPGPPLQIPYGAWGAELSRSYAGRNRVTAFREAFTVVGTLIALAAPAVLPAFGVEGERAVLPAFAVVLAVLLPMTVLSARHGRARAEGALARPARLEAGRGAHGRECAVPPAARGVPRQRPRERPAGDAVPVLRAERLASPDAAGPLLVLYFVCGIAGVPLWLWLARRTSKHRAWSLGMLLACAAFACAPFLGPGDVIAFARRGRRHRACAGRGRGPARLHPG